MRRPHLPGSRGHNGFVAFLKGAEMNHEPNNLHSSGRTRAWRAAGLIITAALAVGVSGFFVGLRQASRFVPVQSPPIPVAVAEASAGAPAVAPRYLDIREQASRPNAGWASDLRALQPRAGQPTDWDRAEERSADWLDRRAFDGAPPVVPHAIDQNNPMSCLACHEKPTQIGVRIAPAMSHPHYANCLQCHASSRGTGIPGERNQAISSLSSFVGAFPLGQASRAGEGAPPTIPHAVTHRESCLSCHGPQGNAPIRTTHPERASCLQCHAPDSKLDQAVPTQWLSDFIRQNEAPGGNQR
jgi:nitrate reductase (cytochrome), electron transfer subunit